MKLQNPRKQCKSLTDIELILFRKDRKSMHLARLAFVREKQALDESKNIPRYSVDMAEVPIYEG